MAHLEVFDPPLCCTTGVCGPAVDPLLAAFAADAEWLQAQGVSVVRHNLAQDPQAFVANDTVSAALRENGDGVLPLLVLDGAIVAQGVYPRRAELARLVGVMPAAIAQNPPIRLSESGCCKPGSGCC